MRTVLGLLSLAAACGSDDAMLPIGGAGYPGGGFILPDGMVRQPDAGVDSGGGDAMGGGDGGSVDTMTPVMITGRVCLLADPRKPNLCADAGAGDITVQLGPARTMTSADGTFTIEAAGDVFRVSGATIKTSYKVLGNYKIPAIPRAIYDTLVTDNLSGVPLSPGEGSLMVQVVRNGLGLTGVSGVSSPPSFWSPFYDDAASPTDWDQDATDADGAIWFPGLAVGSATATVSFSGGATPATQTTEAQPIFDDAITFVTVIL